jgi:Dolichyl-phosphate-mannose-protein mannosyltransferase
VVVRGTLVRTAPSVRLKLGPAARSRTEQAARWAAWIAVLGAIAPIVIYLWVALHRLYYPFEFDWLENGEVNLVGRVLAGKPLYTAPTLAYVSYTYPPLYTYVSAAVAEVTGLGFLPLRLVSFGASLVTFAVLWRWAVAITSDRVAGIVAVGLYAATYGLTGWWFDVGRLDSLFLMFTVAALWAGRNAQGVRGGVAVGVLAFLAFFTKQIALVAIIPALTCLALMRPRAGLSALIVLIASVAVSTLLLDALTDNWYRYFVVSELAGQPWRQSAWIGFWAHDLYSHLRALTLLLVAALAAVTSTWVRRTGGWRSVAARQAPKALQRWAVLVWRTKLLRGGQLGIQYEFTAVAGLLLAAWFSRLHTAGYVNVLLPAYAACALLGALAFAKLRRMGPLPALAATAILLVQFAMLLSRPSYALPSRTESTAGAELITKLSKLPGPVLVLGHPWYGTLVGKGSFAQADAIREVLRSDSARGRVYLNRTLKGSLNRYHIQAVVTDGVPPNWLAIQLAQEFTLKTGMITRHPLFPPAESGSAPSQLYLRSVGRERDLHAVLPLHPGETL